MAGAGVSVGDTVAGYRIEAIAGRGGMGVVFKATQLRLGRAVALKAIAPQLAGDPDFRARFQREAQLAASIEHPNVIPVYEADELDTGELYLAMRWVEGTDLRELLAIEHRLAPAHTVELLAPVAHALAAAHARGLVHRDVKPANVLIADGGDGRAEHVYLTDFGIARLADEEHGLTRTGVFVGTLAYAAPERIQGERAGPAADIYALGCVLFETLTGRPPFNRQTDLATINAHLNEPIPSARVEVLEVPAALDEVVRTALAKQPGERFADAGQMGRAMEHAVAGTSGQTATVGTAATTAPAREPTVDRDRPGDRDQPGDRDLTVDLDQIADGDLTVGRDRTGDRDRTVLETRVPPPRRPRRPVLAGAVLAVAVAAVLIIVLSSGGSTPKGRPAASTPNSSSAHVAVSSLGELPAGGAPGAVAIVDQQTIAVAEPASGRILLMYRSGRPAKPIAVGAGPSALAVDPSGRLWVADADGGDVRVVEPATAKQLADVKLGGSPAAIAIGGGDAWVADQRGNDVRRIGLQSLRPVGGAIHTPGQQPSALAYDPSGAVWVVNKASSDVAVIRDGRAGPAQFVGGGALSISADATAGVWVGTNSGTVMRLSESGAPQGQPLQLHGGAAMVAVLGDTVWVLTHDDATLSSVVPGAAPTITARQSMSPAQAPVALSCIPGECAASDQPTRQVVLATF